MTAKELYERLKADGLENEPLYTMIENSDDHAWWWDEEHICDYEVIDNKVYLSYEPLY